MVKRKKQTRNQIKKSLKAFENLEEEFDEKVFNQPIKIEKEETPDYANSQKSEIGIKDTEAVKTIDTAPDLIEIDTDRVSNYSDTLYQLIAAEENPEGRETKKCINSEKSGSENNANGTDSETDDTGNKNNDKEDSNDSGDGGDNVNSDDSKVREDNEESDDSEVTANGEDYEVSQESKDSECTNSFKSNAKNTLKIFKMHKEQKIKKIQGDLIVIDYIKTTNSKLVNGVLVVGKKKSHSR